MPTPKQTATPHTTGPLGVTCTHNALIYRIKSFHQYLSMKKIFQILFLILISSIVVNCSRPKLIAGMAITDGFENSTISNIWETDKIIPSDAQVQCKIFRSGHNAIQINLHTNDKFEAGKNGNLDSERAELTEVESLISQQGKTYIHTFSIFIPKDFPIVDRRLVLAQWKQECPWRHICDDNSPVLAVRYIAGTLLITQTIGTHRTILWQSNQEYRNRWIDFKFRVCFNTNTNGRILAYLNDSTVVDYSGQTAYNEDSSTGYPSPSRFYFKMGLYRDTMTDPMTIYFDNYSKELLKEDQH
jgi:hypothetical protein